MWVCGVGISAADTLNFHEAKKSSYIVSYDF